MILFRTKKYVDIKILKASRVIYRINNLNYKPKNTYSQVNQNKILNFNK